MTTTSSIVVDRSKIGAPYQVNTDEHPVVRALTANTTPAQFDALIATEHQYNLFHGELGVAASLGNRDLVKHIIRLSGDEKKDVINLANCFGETPLLAATRNGHTEIVRLLLEEGADPNLRSKKWIILLCKLF